MKYSPIKDVDVTSLPSVIEETRNSYEYQGTDLQDIQNGFCEDFAQEVLAQWIGSHWPYQEGEAFQILDTNRFLKSDNNTTNWNWEYLAENWNIFPPADISAQTLNKLAIENPAHVWIYAAEKHYDAENPDGVYSFFDLEFFKRHIKQVKER